MKQNNPLISIQEMRVKRGDFVLDLPDWQVAPGEVIGLVGPNGSGKTTLLETLAGLHAAQKQKLEVFGKDPWKEPVAVRCSLGFMSDTLPIFDMRIGALLRMLSGYYPTWDTKLVNELIQTFQLDINKKTQNLSKGEGTRIRLLIAMAFRPKLLLLDEPASGLDLMGKRALLQSVLDIVRDPERSVLISSHQLADVERISDRLLVLKQGKVVHQGKTDELLGEERTLEEAMLQWGAA